LHTVLDITLPHSPSLGRVIHSRDDVADAVPDHQPRSEGVLSLEPAERDEMTRVTSEQRSRAVLDQQGRWEAGMLDESGLTKLAPRLLVGGKLVRDGRVVSGDLLISADGRIQA